MKESPTTSVQRPANWSCPRLGELGSSTTRPNLTTLTGGSPTLTQARPGLASTARASSRGGFPSSGPRGGKKTHQNRTQNQTAPCPRPACHRTRTPAGRLLRGGQQGLTLPNSPTEPPSCARRSRKPRQPGAEPEPRRRAPDDRPASAERHVPREQQAARHSASAGCPSRAPAAPASSLPEGEDRSEPAAWVLFLWAFWAVVQIRLDLARRLIQGFLVFLVFRFDKTHSRQSPRKTHLYPAGAATKHTFFYLNQQLRFYGFPVF